MRRLLIAGAGSGFTPPPPSTEPFIIVAAPNAGAWTEVQWPHAMYGNGKTYIGWVTGNSDPNDIEVYARVDGGGTEGPILLHANLSDGFSTTPDSHNAPAIFYRSDGKIIAAYCGHSSDTLRIKVSDVPDDITGGFGSPTDISPLDGAYTYPQLFEVGATIYLVFRYQTFGESGFGWVRSTDGGSTWVDETDMYHVTPNLVYVASATNGSRIDFAVTDGPPESPGYGLWHFYMEEDGSVFLSDGTEITGFSYPLAPSDLTEIVNTSGDSYPYGMSYTNDGRPVISCQSKLADPVELFEYRWSGSAWERHDITTSDPISPSILSVGGGHHVWNDTGRFITGMVVGGVQQIWEFLSADDGVTWDAGTQLATTGTTPNSPVAVVDNGPELASMWFIGNFASSDDFDPGLEGVA